MYILGNMMIQLKNAQKARHDKTMVPFSSVKLEITKLLKDNGFLDSYEVKKKKVKNSEFDFINIKLKYDNSGNGAIEDIKLISKPSRRIYIKSNEIKPVKSGYGLMIVSTPKGIISGDQAMKENVGGELIAEIW